MKEIIADLASTVALCSKEGLTPTAMPNVSLYKVTQRIELLPEVYRPVVSLILQGEKQLTIGGTVLRYGAGQTFTASFELPALGIVTQASIERPYLAIRLDINPDVISDLILNMPNLALAGDQRGFAINKADRDLLDAWARMLRLIDRPDEVPVMGPMLEREIVFRLLRGPQGVVLKQLASTNMQMFQIRKAVAMIREKFSDRLRMEDIAISVGMSYSVFHRCFKSATGVSPLQYQKNLRLYEARRLLLTKMTSVSSAAFSVGYESVSQFSREYKRIFGESPMRETRAYQLGQV